MITFEVSEKYCNKKLITVVKAIYPNLPMSSLYKAIRNKDIRVNSVKIKENIILNTGDNVELYINNELLSKNSKPLANSFIYSDNNIVIINKQPGISVHEDKSSSSEITLDKSIKELLISTNNTDGLDSGGPYLCHRLDRNTGGLLIFAKNMKYRDLIMESIKKREIKKIYKCLVWGIPAKSEATLKHYLFKDSAKNQVFVSDVKKTGYVEIITKYKVIKSNSEVSLLEVELITGKTHQIRAHLAHIGCPIVGDSKYGSNKENKKASYKHQALWATKLVFETKNSLELSYLYNKSFEVDPQFNI
jgi:23S rRNA pseudouridine955/2504/2580 synthase